MGGTNREEGEELSYLERSLSEEPRFRQGWNCALWEVHKMLMDGMKITPELLKDMVRWHVEK